MSAILTVDWRRLLIALPLLAGAGVLLYVFAFRGGSVSAPRAVLLETFAPQGQAVGARKGQVARDFLAVSPDGQAVRLSELRGRPTVINFWATWCTSCLAEMPDLKEVQAQLGADRLNVLAVNVGEDAGRANDFLQALAAPAFHVALDPTLVVADAYGVRGLPQSFFVDSEGFIRAAYTGQLDQDLMREYVLAASTGVTTGEPPRKLRFVTTVPRRRVLEVNALSGDRVEFRSKSLRCDGSYCADAVIDRTAATRGVASIERYAGEDPPRVVVAFDSTVIEIDGIVDLLVQQLGAHEDPLYDGPIGVVGR